jgi:hypothetical protein
MAKTELPYPPEFRREAVRPVRSSGRSMPSIAVHFGSPRIRCCNWAFVEQVEAGGRDWVSSDELGGLRRQLTVLEQSATS